MNVKLYHLHNKLNFTNKKLLKKEIPEQLMALKHISKDDVVLELGGSIGRNTCVISTILSDSSNLVTIEPNINEIKDLKINRELNNFKFHIEENVLSKQPLYSLGWYTYIDEKPDSLKVDNITWPQLKKKYNLHFNVLIVDNEGHFVSTLKDYPDILNDIRMINIEHDFNSIEDLDYFYDVMKRNKFQIVDTYMKNDEYGPGMDWTDGVDTDDIFVSVWKRVVNIN